MLNLLKRKKSVVVISPSIVVFTAAFFGILYLFYTLREIVVILFMAFILMVALNPAVNKLQKIVKSRVVSIFIIYLLLIVVISSIIATLVPPLAQQLTQLLRTIEMPYFQDEVANLRFTVQELNQLAADYGGSIETIITIVSSTFRSLFHSLTLLFISFYLMIDEPNLHKKIGWFTAEKRHFKLARKFLDDIEEQLGGWIRGQIIIMSIVGLITYLGLEIIGVPYALPLGMIAFALEILPNLGPTLAAIPGIGIALLHGGLVPGLVVLIFYIVLQQFESSVLTPRVMKSNADVNPLVSILGILSGFKLGGVVGGLLAIPIYILLRTIYGYYLKYQKKLKVDW